MQAQAGVEVLFEWQERRHKQMPPNKAWAALNSTSFVDADLLGTFARVDTLVMLFKDMHSIRHPLLKGTTVEFPAIPSEFSSVNEARLLWDIFIQTSSHWRYAFPQDSFSSLDFGEKNIAQDGSGEREALAQKFLAESVLYATTLDQWHVAFLPVFNRTRKRSGTKDFLGASALMLKYLSTRIAVASSSAASETASDSLRGDYIHAIELARDLLVKHGNRSPGKAIFVFDENLICALFLVAIRCRECRIRREAISLLWNYPRREGLWDSSMAAKIATWIMNAEEDGMVDGYVPETARLIIVQNDFVLSQRKAVIRCSRLIEGGNERVVLPEVTLTW
jgi:hypothetical protein